MRKLSSKCVAIAVARFNADDLLEVKPHLVNDETAAAVMSLPAHRRLAWRLLFPVIVTLWQPSG